MTIYDTDRSNPIGDINERQMSIIVTCLCYRKRQMMYNIKRKLDNNKDNIYINESLTKTYGLFT